MISTAEAHVAALFVQAVLYGVFVSTLAHSFRWLFYNDEGWKLRDKINWAMVAISILVFSFSTADLAVSLRFTGGPHVSNAYALTLSNVNNALELATILIIDGVLIYRCWVVHAKSWRVIYIPLFFWAASLVTSILVIYYYSLLIHPAKHHHKSFQPEHAFIAFFSCNIAINIYATSAIIYRILSAVQDGTGTSDARLSPTCRILAESGILYTATSLLNLIATALDTHPQFEPFREIADALNFSMAGIAFNLILIRVGQRRTDDYIPHHSWNGTWNGTGAGVLSALRFRSSVITTSSFGDAEQRFYPGTKGVNETF